MIKNFRIKSTYKNYRTLRKELGINKDLSKELIKSTHNVSDIFHCRIYAIECLIRECQTSFYKGTRAYDYITKNIETKTKETKEDIENMMKII